LLLDDPFVPFGFGAVERRSTSGGRDSQQHCKQEGAGERAGETQPDGARNHAAKLRAGREITVTRRREQLQNCAAMSHLQLTTTLQARGPAAAVILDDDQISAIGKGKKRFPVRATINGYSWRTTVTPMRGEYLLGLNKEVRAGASVEAGDTVEVLIELDTEPREIEVPEALATALAGDAVARATFEGMSFTHRKEYVRWIEEAKRDETREKRVAQALERLRLAKPPR
jgi:hypothetical protein